jgi:hypothetical protein
MSGRADDARLERARAVLRAHRDRLLEEHAASGVGVGMDDDGQPAIIVYLPRGRALSARGEVDGVPLIFRPMGPLKPM